MNNHSFMQDSGWRGKRASRTRSRERRCGSSSSGAWPRPRSGRLRVTPTLGNPYTVFRAVIADAIRHGDIPRQDVELATSLVTGAIIQVIDTRILGRLKGRLGKLTNPVATGAVRLLGGP